MPHEQTPTDQQIVDRLRAAARPLLGVVKVIGYGESIQLVVRGADGEHITGSPWEFRAADLRAPAALDQVVASIQAAVLEALR